jgi:NAD(P)-dependent dehydrogenase (short-subunit alcohol dehydrogenase family)
MSSSLRQAPGVHTAVVDVTNEAAVQGLAEWVEAENPGGVYAVVNNAGTTVECDQY